MRLCVAKGTLVPAKTLRCGRPQATKPCCAQLTLSLVRVRVSHLVTLLTLLTFSHLTHLVTLIPFPVADSNTLTFISTVYSLITFSPQPPTYPTPIRSHINLPHINTSPLCYPSLSPEPPHPSCSSPNTPPSPPLPPPSPSPSPSSSPPPSPSPPSHPHPHPTPSGQFQAAPSNCLVRLEAAGESRFDRGRLLSLAARQSGQ